MNLIALLEKEQIERLSQNKALPKIEPGDTIQVTWRIREKNAGSIAQTARVQIIEGVVIKVVKKGIMSSVTFHKSYQGGWVNCTLPLSSPLLQKIEIIKRAKVRRAKLYYLIGRTGKAARLKARKNSQ